MDGKMDGWKEDGLRERWMDGRTVGGLMEGGEGWMDGGMNGGGGG